MDMILESCKLASISPEEIRRRMKFTNVEQVNALLRQGKSVFFRRGAGRGNFAHFKKIHSSGKIKPSLPRRQGGARPRSREKPRAGRNAPPHIQRLTRKKMKVTTAKSAMTPSVTK